MVPVLALSLQDQVEKYGAYVGIAAFIGLAVLSLLYFAQARELKRLRDWAGRAPERAAELEARVTATAEEARRVPEPAPEPERSGTVGPAQPVPKPATAGAAGNGRPTETPAPVPLGPRPAVAAAAAAAARGAAPATATPAEAAPEAPDGGAPTAPEPAGTAGAAVPAAPAAPAGPGAPDGAPKPAGPEEAGQGDRAPAPAQETEDAPALASIPRATPRPQPPRPAQAAPLRRPATARPAKAPPRRPTSPQARRASAGSDPSTGRMAIFAVAAVLVIAIGAFAATQLFGGDEGGQQANAPNVTTDPQPTPRGGGGGNEDVAAARPETVVVVLNGTPVTGLASDKRDELLEAGYAEETGVVRIETNDDQTRQDSAVFYADGQRRQARDVASVLGIDSSPEPVDPETQALADNTDVSGELPAEVTVVLGADQTP